MSLPGFVSGIVEFFNWSLEWNGRCTVEKISQNYTKSQLMSIARIVLQGLQNCSRRKMSKTKSIKEGKNTLSIRTPVEGINQHSNDGKKVQELTLGVWTPKNKGDQRSNTEKKNERLGFERLCAAFDNPESLKLVFFLRVRTVNSAFEC